MNFWLFTVIISISWGAFFPNGLVNAATLTIEILQKSSFFSYTGWKHSVPMETVWGSFAGLVVRTRLCVTFFCQIFSSMLQVFLHLFSGLFLIVVSRKAWSKGSMKRDRREHALASGTKRSKVNIQILDSEELVWEIWTGSCLYFAQGHQTFFSCRCEQNINQNRVVQNIHLCL